LRAGARDAPRDAYVGGQPVNTSGASKKSSSSWHSWRGCCSRFGSHFRIRRAWCRARRMSICTLYDARLERESALKTGVW